ncbi:MAG: hypothetical protein MR924_03550 [Prevotella sp.]|nr:hypothetical protein [Prevotella sp.]
MIESNYKRIPKEKLRRTKTKLYNDPLFSMIYMPLWHQRKGDLTPVEVWQEATMVIQEMKAISRDIRHLEVSTIVEELNERYSAFDNVARTEEMAQHTTMLVLATVMFMLAEADADWKHNPHLPLCRSISQILNRIDGFKELCSNVRTEESYLAEANTPLPIRDFMGEEKKKVEYDNARTFTEDEINVCGINDPNPGKVLQAISLIQQKMTADNDWIAVYAVLLERRLISPTMTTFCTMINRIFKVNIRNRYLSGVLRDHGEDIAKWSDHYEDQRRHRQLAKEFEEILDR